MVKLINTEFENVVFYKYRRKNRKIFPINKFWFMSRYDNNLNFCYYIVQKLFKHGKKLKLCRILFDVIRLFRKYSYYGFCRHKKYYNFRNLFNHDSNLMSCFRSQLPIFSLKLENEYLGKRKTRKKIMKPFIVISNKSKVFELITWLKRISFKFNYRSFMVRFSIILFNIFFYSNSNCDIIKHIRSDLKSVKNKKKIYVGTESEIKAMNYFKKVLWQLTMDRLKIKIRPTVDNYFKKICLKYHKNPDYIHDHMLIRISLKKYWMALVAEKKLKWSDIGKETVKRKAVFQNSFF